MKPKFILIALFILHITFLFSDTIIDTLYSIPDLDGDIQHNSDNNTYFANASSWRLNCGDYAYISFGCVRGYLSFSLPEIPDGYELQNAEIFIYQTHSAGNGNGGQFPIWDIIPPPDTTGCIIDHIDYGNQLDEGDWTAGDLGDSQTLHSNIGVISDNASLVLKNLNVTSNVQEDYDTDRDKTQYRIRFMVNNDWDQYDDYLKFYTSNSLYKPFIIYTWWDGVNSVDNYEIHITNYKICNYPNPFNPSTTIEFSIQNDSNVELNIFNIRGQKIKTLTHNEFTKGDHSVIWNGDDESNNPVSSGIYYYKLKINGKTEAAKKCLLLK